MAPTTRAIRLLSIAMASMIMLLVLPLLGSLPPAHARPAASCAAAKVVARAARDFMKAGKSGSPVALARALKRHVHMRRVMLFALGRHARKLSPAQKALYIRRATRYASRQLAQVGRGVKSGKVEIISCRGNRVVTRIGSSKVIWKIRGGRIIDVNFRGMWMAQLLRGRFRRMLRESNNNMATFLARLN